MYFSAAISTRTVLVVLFLLISAVTVNGQSFLSSEWFEMKKEQKERREAEGRVMVTPLAGPGYSPELKFVIGGGIIFTFLTDRSDTVIQRSTVPVEFGISTTGALFFVSKTTTFWLEDRLRIYADINFKHMPDNYWGVGYENGRYTEKSDSTTAYDRTWWQIYPRFLWQFSPNYFAGIGVDYNYTHGTHPSIPVEEDPYYVEYNNLPMNSGIGLIFQYDTRDIPVNPYNGIFIELMSTWYTTSFGGDNDYQIYNADVRKYWTIRKPGHTLAVQGRGRFGTGNVPYGEMSQLGTPWDLRGYTWGRFRDNSMLYYILEYRHMFYKKNDMMSKHGAVVWHGGGTIANDIHNPEKYLPNVGVGYRFEVQPRMNIRLDVGFGTDSYGFYFNFTEAF